MVIDNDNNATGKAFNVINNGATGNVIFSVQDSGRVGMGTTSPLSKLHIKGHVSESHSGSLFKVEGSSGSLFEVVDSLSGSLMSVNDISGLPILEVFDTDKVVMGSFNQNTLVVTGSKVGIGTSIPATTFQFAGGNTAAEGIRINDASYPTYYGGIYYNASGTGGINFTLSHATSY